MTTGIWPPKAGKYGRLTLLQGPFCLNWVGGGGRALGSKLRDGMSPFTDGAIFYALPLDALRRFSPLDLFPWISNKQYTDSCSKQLLFTTTNLSLRIYPSSTQNKCSRDHSFSYSIIFAQPLYSAFSMATEGGEDPGLYRYNTLIGLNYRHSYISRESPNLSPLQNGRSTCYFLGN